MVNYVIKKEFIILISFFILFSNFNLHSSQYSEYSDLEVSDENENNKFEQLKMQDSISKLEPKFPVIYPKFVCDPDIKLNTVKQDVMTDKNYNK